MTTKRTAPAPIDILVGGRIRLRRSILKMSQTYLSEQLGISFQKVQKYKKETNRIGAGRFFRIALILDTDVSFFYGGLKITDYKNTSFPAPSEDVLLFTNEKDGIRLNS